MERDTVGKLSSELIPKAVDNTHTAEDQMREQLADYEKNVWLAVDEGKKKHADDFYVVVLTKKERLMENVLRNYFFTRNSCPTPEWDQTLYKYYRKYDALNYLWTIPDKHTCEMFKTAKEISSEEMQLAKFVHDFHDGILMKVAKKLNNEQEKSPLLTN